MERHVIGAARTDQGRQEREVVRPLGRGLVVAFLLGCWGFGGLGGGGAVWGADATAFGTEAKSEQRVKSGEEKLKETRRVESFELRDQFDRKREVEFPRMKICVVVVADQKGSKQLESWVRPLAERFGERVDFEGIADVSAAPAPLRGLVRNAFRKHYVRPVMLDWDGKVVRAFGYRKQVPNVFVIDREGRVHGHAVGAATVESVEGVVRLVEGLLRAVSTEGERPGPATADR